MKKDKGFTLIEVLAVIAILGLVLIIVVPKVTDTIYNSRKNVFKLNASSYMSEAKKIYQNKYAGTLKDNIIYKIINGKLYDEDNEFDVIDGNFDGNGFVQVDENGRVKLSIKNEEFCATKEINSNEVVVNDYDQNVSCGEIYIPLYVELNGGVTTQEFDEEYVIGTKLELVEPTKITGDFIKWEVVKGNSTLADNILTIGDKETILYAMWQSKAKLEIDLNGGSIENDVSSYYTTGTIVNLGIPTKEDYTFKGWKRETGDSEKSGNTLTMGTTDTKIKAEWELNVFKFDINLNNGSSSQTFNNEYEVGTVIELVTPTRVGYTFDGWTVTSGRIDGNTFTMGNEDVVITANWQLNTYTISYNLNGGTNGSSAPTSGAYGSTVTVSNPTRTGYKFTGWTVSGTGAIMSGTSLTIGTSNITLIANWKISNPITAYSCANGSSGSVYLFTYTGNCSVIDDGSGNWRVKFLSSGNLVLYEDIEIDLFLVGGGGGGGKGNDSADTRRGGGGGGGGYTTTAKNLFVSTNTSYQIVVGGGGGSQSSGGTSSAFNFSASGGSGGVHGAGGNGGSGGGNPKGGGGASYGASSGGIGQGRTTCEFGEGTTSGCNSGITAYAGGGGAGGHKDAGISGGSGGAGGGGAGSINSNGNSGVANTGGGGGGAAVYYSSGGSGGSGVVIIRNAREVSTDANTIPRFTYTGTYAIVDDKNETIGVSDGNWKVRFLTSGTLKFTSLGNASDGIDLFLVGGGGVGNDSADTRKGGGGGGGGKTQTIMNIKIQLDTEYNIVIGSGGGSQIKGGTSSAFGYSVDGGNGGSHGFGGAGGSGGGAPKGGAGASYGNSAGGAGQGTTTCEFGEGTTSGCNSYVLVYSGGGGAGGHKDSGISGGSGGSGGGGSGSINGNGNPGAVNTGGGGGGAAVYYSSGGTGGSGVVIIRNKR